jgi:hypothetical protein
MPSVMKNKVFVAIPVHFVTQKAYEVAQASYSLSSLYSLYFLLTSFSFLFGLHAL